MAMGQRRPTQPDLFIFAAGLPRSPGRPFYGRLNQLPHEHLFDSFAQGLCARFYHDSLGRPGLAPGRYSRPPLLGYFEGLDPERGIAWRAADSLSPRAFLGRAPGEAAPDHSTLSRTRRLIDLEAHEEVFRWVLKVLAGHDLIRGKAVGIGAATPEADAALRPVVRRDAKETYEELLARLARAPGIETPTREDRARPDKGRKSKASNEDWGHPHDPDGRAATMRGGTTHLAHKVEHAVDPGEGAAGGVLAVTPQAAGRGDTDTLLPAAGAAVHNPRAVAGDPATQGKIAEGRVAEVVTDKGYHSSATLSDLAELEIRSHGPEPERGRRGWEGKEAEREAAYANRRRVRGRRGKRLLRRRGEYLGRSFAHAYETGGLRRVHLRGRENILKRLLVHVGGFNLGLVMRGLVGRGPPRGSPGAGAGLAALFLGLWAAPGRWVMRATTDGGPRTGQCRAGPIG